MGVSKTNEVQRLNKKIVNWASDDSFATETRTKILSNLNVLKSDREEREERWREFYNMWSIEDDDNKSYEGRANLYVPQVRKEVETMTRRLKKALLPEDYVECEATKMEDASAAQTNKYVLRHFFDGPINIKSLADPFLKQLVLYGTSPLKTFWHQREVEQYVRSKKMVKNSQGGWEPKYSIEKEKTLLYNAPKVRVCDLFQTFVSPTSAQTPQDIREVYEISKITWSQLQQKQKDGAAWNIKRVKDQGKEKDQEFEETQERLADQGDSATIVGSDKIYDLLEWWGELDLPNGQRIPCVVEIINETTVIRIQQNPFWHQCPPYAFARFIKSPPGEFYGRGLPEAIQYLQYQLNDTMNQTVDSATLALNNITIVNPAFAPNVDSFEIESGAIWWADPNAVKQFTFPDLSDTGLKNANAIRQIITESSDNSPQLPDPISGKARSTGQAQLAIDEWQTDLFSFMQSIESEALEPLCNMVHSLLQQYVQDDLIIRTVGKFADSWIRKIVTPEDLAGRYDFKWKGAIQTQNSAVKNQQILNFIKVAQGIPGIQINWPNLLMKFFREGLQFKDAHMIVSSEIDNPSMESGLENKMIEMGGPVEVHPSDDDRLHIAVHEAYKKKVKDEYAKYRFDLHIAKHNAQLNQKVMAEQQAIMMAQMQAAQQGGEMMGNEGMMGQNSRSGGRGGANNPMGNQGQINESTTQADIERGMKL